MSADVLYISLILAGIIGFINNPDFLAFVGILWSLFLLYLAYGIYKNRAQRVDIQTEKIQTKNLFKIYTHGFILTLFNPYTIIFRFSIAGCTANKNLNIGFTILGMMSSITLWTTIMPYLLHRTKHKISQRTSKYLSVFSLLILFSFASFAVYKRTVF